MNMFISVMEYAGPLVFVGALCAAGVADIWKFRIPNIFPVILTFAFPLMAFSAPAWAVDWAGHVLAFAAVLAGGMLLWRFRLLGGGDAKLLAATSFWFGLDGLPFFLILVGVLGGALVLILIVLRHLIVMVGATSSFIQERNLPKVLISGESVPYGVAISIAAISSIADIPVFGHIVYLGGSIV